MSEIPKNLKYANSHEWARKNDDGSVTIGITYHAQKLLGDLVYVELPEVGANFNREDECATVESVKSASEVYSPISGEVLAVNEELEGTPNLINDQPYESGWLFTLKPSNLAQLDEMMSADEYAALAEEA